MRRSMEESQGGEEEEIQAAIRLSLREMGMSYSQENLEVGHEQVSFFLIKSFSAFCF